jgi:hypothetical protein
MDAGRGHHGERASIAILCVGSMQDGLKRQAVNADEDMALPAFDRLSRVEVPTDPPRTHFPRGEGPTPVWIPMAPNEAMRDPCPRLSNCDEETATGPPAGFGLFPPWSACGCRHPYFHFPVIYTET